MKIKREIKREINILSDLGLMTILNTNNTTNIA